LRIRKAVIPAAGLGTRMFPASKATPKELFPLADRPMIHYAVEEAILSGIEDIVIVISPGKKKIIEYFNEDFPIQCLSNNQLVTEKWFHWQSLIQSVKISFIIQQDPCGLGDAILQTKDFIGMEPFAVLLPDDIVVGSPSATSQLLEAARVFGSSVIGVTQLDRSEIPLYGIINPKTINDDSFQVLAFVEKPPVEQAPSNLGIVGRYILTPAIFRELESLKLGKSREIHLTDALGEMGNNEVVYAQLLKGMRLDAGNPLGYLTSCIKLGLYDSQLSIPLKQWIKRELAAGNLLEENLG